MKTSAVEVQVKSFIAKYSPAVAKEFGAARAHLRALFPRGCELVYDNYNALAIGFGPSERAGEAILSIAAYPKWVTLFFLRGTTLADPHGLLSGTGSRVRSIRLASAAQLKDARVAALISKAIAPQRAALHAAAPLVTVIRAVSAKQRARQPPAPARPAKRTPRTSGAS